MARSRQFSTVEFYGEISSAINEQIDIQIEGFKRELLSVAKKGGNKTVNDENVGECCDKLRKRMKTSYEKNMKKFSTYADRNIFVARVNVQTVGKSDSNEKNGSPTQELNVKIDEVEALKTKYLALRANHIKLTKECKEGDLLLKDMRKSLFTIRVGAQTLDECKVQPLIETVAILEQHQQTMTELTSKAKDLKRQMSEFCEENDLRTVTEQEEQTADLSEQIKTAGQDDLNLLNRNF